MNYKQILIVLTVVLISCKSQKENVVVEKKEDIPVEVKKKPMTDLVSIEGNYYVVSLGDLPEIEGRIPTIKIEKTGNISGNNACNTYFGNIKPDAEGSIIQQLGSTRKLCEGASNDTERVLMNYFRQVSSIVREGNLVHFMVDDKEVIVAKEINVEASWYLLTLNGKTTGKNKLSFQVEQNSINGHTGCNSFFGEVTQDGFDISFKNISATEMACDQITPKLESEFLRALSKVTRYQIMNHSVIFFENNTELFTASLPK